MENWQGPRGDKIPKFKREKLPSTDPEYNEHQREIQGMQDTSSHLFDGALLMLDRIIENQKSSLKNKQYHIFSRKELLEGGLVLEQRKKQEVEKIRTFLVKNIFIPGPLTMRKLTLRREYLDVLWSSEGLRKKFEKLLKVKFNVPSDRFMLEMTDGDCKTFIDKCADFISENPQTLDDDFITKMSHERKDLFEKQEEYIEKNKEKLQNDFVVKFEVLKSKYDLDIDIETVISKLNSVQVGCVDPLIAQLEGIGGRYIEDVNRIEIKSSVKTREETVHIYNHEALHAISGKTILKEDVIETEGEEDPFPGYYHKLRAGLRFQNPNNYSYGRGERNLKFVFKWLDEAVTESLAIEMVGGKDRGIYASEREMLNFLIDKSNGQISMADFCKPYFEDYQTNATEKIPYWNILMQKIQSTYGPAFIQKLDEYVRKNGIKKTVEYLKSDDWRNI